MPWTVSDPPAVAQNWTEEEIEACVAAANAVLEEGGTEEEAIFACIHAAGRDERIAMDEQFERRVYAVEDLEVRQLDDGPEIVGYAAVFNQRSVDLGGFVEEVAPGAFRETLAASPDVRATVDHRGGVMLLGRTRSGTLTLREDERGLRVRIRPPETSAARDILTLLRRGDMDQMSFMFRVDEDEWQREGDLALRRLKRVDLDDGDVSVVTYAAYPQTTVSARARARVEELRQQSTPEGEAEGGPASGNELADVESEVRSTNLRVRLEIAKRK